MGWGVNMISAKELVKSYSTGTITTTVLHEVNLALEKSKIGVILGPSGSGKSTLMNIIGGIDRADSGEIKVDGTVLSDLNDDELTEYRRSEIGFIFQFYNLVPNLTVSENIEVCTNISESPLPLEDVLRAVGLSDERRRFPKELSGGEQQRVSIARAIVKNPKLLLCDEPTGALDFETSRGVLALLQRINADYGTTILMITHNTAIADMSHTVFKLRNGMVVERMENAEIVPAERIEW